jgi:ankyrin repeat protein
VDLRQVEWYWGCPLSNYADQHSIDGDSRGFDWNRLFFDVLFWVFYFSLLGLGSRALLRKIGVNIRPGYCLIGLWILTVGLYTYLYRPDILINVETGGFLSFMESPPKQMDMAMRFGDVEALKELFRKHPELVSSADITGRTPLHQAAYWGQNEIMRLLLSDKANIEAKDMTRQTPLFKAAICGCTGAAELLIRNGAQVNIVDDFRETPMMAAAGGGNYGTVLLLLACKAHVNTRDREGMSALHEAAIGGHRNVAQLLMASNADVNMRDNEGETPLFCAVKDGRSKVVQLLLFNGADVDATNKYGTTPMQLALENGYTNIVELIKRPDETVPIDPPTE